MLTLDHIAIAAETLEEGVEYVETTLGVSMAAPVRQGSSMWPRAM